MNIFVIIVYYLYVKIVNVIIKIKSIIHGMIFIRNKNIKLLKLINIYIK